MEELLKDLGLSSVEELVAYMRDPAHQDEPIVKELIVFVGMMLDKEIDSAAND